MTQEATFDNNQVHVALSGSIYLEDAAAVLKYLIDLLDKGHASFHIDLSTVDYSDIAGFEALLALSKRVRARNGDVVIKDLNGLAQRSVRAHPRGKRSFH